MVDASVDPSDGGDFAADVSSAFDGQELDASARSQQREKIAASESKLVFWLRMLVFLLLICSAIAVVVGVYLYLSDQEEDEFERKFESDSTKIFEAVGKRFDQVLGSTDAFIMQVLTYARYSESPWPYVTFPSFALHASKLIRLSKAFQFNIGVFVPPDEGEKWVNYTMDHKEWIEECKQIQASDEDWKRNTDFPTPINDEVHMFTGDAVTEPTPHTGDFLIGWQQYPIVEDDEHLTVNQDMLTVPPYAANVVAALQEQRVVITGGATTVLDEKNMDNPVSQIVKAKATAFAEAHIPEGVDPSEPMSGIVYPM